MNFELVDEGYEVHCAADFAEAASALPNFDYDCIISDIFIDRGNANQLMDLVKQKNRYIPFIVITAFTGSELAL